MYPLESIDVRPFDESEMNIAPEYAYFTKPANWGMTPEQRREAIRAYYATISFVDAQIGQSARCAGALKLAETHDRGVLERSRIQLGEHGQWMKQTVFEWSARAPFIVPERVYRRGARTACGRWSSWTCIRRWSSYAACTGTPTNLHGRSLVPLLKNPSASWSKPAISQVRRGQAEKAVHGHSFETSGTGTRCGRAANSARSCTTMSGSAGASESR